MPTLTITPVDDAEAEVWSLAREVAGPVAMRAELTTRERGYLRQRAEMMDRAHSGWDRVSGAENGAIALSILVSGG